MHTFCCLLTFKNTSAVHSDSGSDFSPDMNLNLLSDADPCLSDAQPELQNTNDEEMEEVTDFVETIFSDPVVANYSVKPIPKLVEYSEANNYWHVKSGLTGNFSISFSFDGMAARRRNLI